MVYRGLRDRWTRRSCIVQYGDSLYTVEDTVDRLNHTDAAFLDPDSGYGIDVLGDVPPGYLPTGRCAVTNMNGETGEMRVMGIFAQYI